MKMSWEKTRYQESEFFICGRQIKEIDRLKTQKRRQDKEKTKDKMPQKKDANVNYSKLMQYGHKKLH